METPARPRCRVAACPEALGDGKTWSFYLINDDDVPLDRVMLKTFGHEWGDMGPTIHPNVQVTDLAPGANILIWRDDDDEMRMWLVLVAKADEREVEFLLEFPKLHRLRENLPLIDDLGKRGWEAVAEVALKLT